MSGGAGQQPTHPSSQTGPNPGEKISLYKIAYKLSLQKIGFLRVKIFLTAEMKYFWIEWNSLAELGLESKQLGGQSAGGGSHNEDIIPICISWCLHLTQHSV